MVLAQIRFATHRRFLAMQKIFRYIHSEYFEEAYNIATDEEKQKVSKYIENGDKDNIVLWCRTILRNKEAYELLPVLELRQRAKNLGVKDYNVLTKDSLLSRIFQIEKGKEDARKNYQIA